MLNPSLSLQEDCYDSIDVLMGKRCANICEFAIHNPLHVYFEDGNYIGGAMTNEYKWNAEYREVNGEKMFKYIEAFLNIYTELSKEQRKLVITAFEYYWEILNEKRDRILDAYNTCGYVSVVKSDGVYWELGGTVSIKAF